MKGHLTINFFLLVICFASCNPEPDQETEKDSVLDSVNQELPDTAITKLYTTDSALWMEKCATHRVPPNHNMDKDTTIRRFVRSLEAVVRSKDKKALLKLLDKGIISSHGGGITGIREFEQEWQLDKKPDNSRVWHVLSRMIALGGCFDVDENNQVFIMPYLQAPQYYATCDYDWFSTGVCTSPEVYLYEKADVKSRILDTFNYRVLECGYEKQAIDSFVAVQTIDGKKKGFVKENDIYFSADYMLVIEKKAGKWLVVSFAPFD